MCVKGVYFEAGYSMLFNFMVVLYVLCNSENTIHHVLYHPSLYFPTTTAVTFSHNS